MNFNYGFPATYQPLNYGFQPYQQQMQGTQMPLANQPQQQQPQQMMTPPTIRAEIIQVDDEIAAENYPVGQGSSQMMMKKDDSEIYVKSVLANNQVVLDVFVKRPKMPPKPTFDPDIYVTREELEKRLQAITERNKPIPVPMPLVDEKGGLNDGTV